MISTFPFLNTPTHEYVVPRSIPMVVPVFGSSSAKTEANGNASAVTVTVFQKVQMNQILDTVGIRLTMMVVIGF